MNVLRSICAIASVLTFMALSACSGGGVGEPGTTTPEPQAKLRADAGLDQSVFVGRFVTLDGSKSTNANQTGLIYAWTLAKPAGSNATLSNPTSVNPTLTVDIEGTYEATLIVTDARQSTLSSEPDRVLVTAAKSNLPPTANAGDNRDVFVGQPVTLDGSGSRAAGNKPLTFNWSFTTKPAGSNATLSSSTAEKPTFTPDASGPYDLRLVVNDGTNDSTPASVTITAAVRPRPTADAGLPQSAKPNTPVTLDGSKSKAADNGPLTYRWIVLTTPGGKAASLANADTKSPTFTANEADQSPYVVQLTVNDGTSDSTPVTVNITVSNDLPLARAGDDQNNAKACQTVTLTGNESKTSNDGAIAPDSYVWTFDLQPTSSFANLANANTVSPTFTPDRSGDYRAMLIVKEGALESSPAFVKITVTPTNPGEGYGESKETTDSTCAGCHALGTFDTSGSPDLSMKLSTVVQGIEGIKKKFPALGQPGVDSNHDQFSLSQNQIDVLCGIFLTN